MPVTIFGVETHYAINNYNTSQPMDIDYDDLYNGGMGNLVYWEPERYGTLGEFCGFYRPKR